MKLLFIAVLSFVSASSFAAKCEVLTHKAISSKTISALVDIKVTTDLLKNTEFSKYTKKPNFGLKEKSIELSTGKKNIFNEDITETFASLYLYENGVSVYSTPESTNFKQLVSNIIEKLNELGCN